MEGGNGYKTSYLLIMTGSFCFGRLYSQPDCHLEKLVGTRLIRAIHQFTDKSIDMYLQTTANNNKRIRSHGSECLPFCTGHLELKVRQSWCDDHLVIG